MRIPFFSQKEFAEISFVDVVDFCHADRRENSMLDYKKDLSDSVSKTICAMANGGGGVIIVGVEEGVNDCPKQPCVGRTGVGDGDITKIENWTADNIWPPVLFHSTVCKNAEASHHFILLNIPESHHAPHRWLPDDTVPVRVTQRSVSKPGKAKEKNADPEVILNMMQKREESLRRRMELRGSSSDRAAAVVGFGDQYHLIPKIHLSASVFSIRAPIFPYRDIGDAYKITTNYKAPSGNFSYPYPLFRKHKPINEGMFSYFSEKPQCTFGYIEVNAFGFVNLITSLRRVTGESSVMGITHEICVFLDFVYKVLCETGGYSGALDIELKIENIRGIPIPLPNGDEAKCADVSINFSRLVPITTLEDQRSDLAASLINDVCWSLGSQDDVTDDIRFYSEKIEKIP